MVLSARSHARRSGARSGSLPWVVTLALGVFLGLAVLGGYIVFLGLRDWICQ